MAADGVKLILSKVYFYVMRRPCVLEYIRMNQKKSFFFFSFNTESCTVAEEFSSVIKHCDALYDFLNEDNKDYGVAWVPYNASLAPSNRRRRDATWIVKHSDRKNELEQERFVRQRRSTTATSGNAYQQMATGRNKQLRRRNQMKGRVSGKPIYYVSPEAMLPDGSVISCHDRWEYFTNEELRGFPVPGRVTTYSGGGYVANLGYNEETSWTVLADLHSHNWFDKQTRAVFAEFTIYNGNINLFLTAFLYIETLPTGGAFPWVDFKVFNGYRYSAKDGLQSMWAEMVFILFICYFTVREIRKLMKQKRQYFKSFFNLIEVTLIPLYLMMFGLIIVRWLTTSANIKTFKENPKDFVSFQYSAAADSALMAVIGVVCFLLNIKFLRLMQFAKLFFVVGQVFKSFAVPLMWFMIPFTLYFLLFAWCAHLGFGSQMEDYMSIPRTITTQFLHLLGASDFESVYNVSAIFGPLYYLAYAAFMVMVCFNMFMAIVCEAIDGDYDEEYQRQAGDIQVASYISRNLKELLGIATDEDYEIHADDQPPEREDLEEKMRKTDQVVTEFELCISRLERIVEEEEKNYDLDGDAGTPTENNNTLDENNPPENTSDENNLDENSTDVDSTTENVNNSEKEAEKESDLTFGSMEQIRI